MIKNGTSKYFKEYGKNLVLLISKMLNLFLEDIIPTVDFNYIALFNASCQEKLKI